MHNIDKFLTLKSPIINLQILQNGLVAVSTKQNGAEIFSYNDKFLKPILKLESLAPTVESACFSQNGNFFAFEAKFKIFIFDIHAKKIITKIPLDEHDVDMISFDTSSKHLIVGTTGGRVFQYRYNSPLVLDRLCSFPYERPTIQPKIVKGFVTAMAFYGSLFACSGYGGAVFVIDLQLNTQRQVITHTRVTIEALCFVDKQTLIIGNNDGVIDIINLKDTKISTKIQTPFSKISKIILMPNTNYIMVSSNANYIVIIDIDAKKIINDNYVEFDDKITNIEVLNTHALLIVLKNSSVYKLKLPTLLKLDSLIINNSIHQVFRLIEKEPIVLDDSAAKKLEDEYNKIYTKAIHALINNNKKSAINILRVFKDIPSKQKDIKLLFEGFENYQKFKLNVEKERYFIAYEMCESYPVLKQTDPYSEMEDEWNKDFLNAQKQLFLGNNDGAKNILHKYKDIKSKKNKVSFLFKYYDDLLVFIKAIHCKDSKTICEISQKHSIFKEIPAFINLEQKIKGSLKLVKNCINKSNTKLARNLLGKLHDIPHIAHNINELYLKCHYIERLEESYKNNDLLSCYRMLDSQSFLNNSQLGKTLEKQWAELINRCEVYALKGDIKDIELALGELINLQSRKEKIGDLLRVSFHSRINHLIEKNLQKVSKTIISSYLDIFGKDTEIDEIIKKYESVFNMKIELDKEYEKKSRDSWKDSDIIMRFSNS